MKAVKGYGGGGGQSGTTAGGRAAQSRTISRLGR